MSFAALLALAFGLAMDATAVAATRGLAVARVRPRHIALVALYFGGFQALMPLVGWLIGSKLGPLVAAWDHWIAFGLLGAIGGKMLWEARGAPRDDARASNDPFAPATMLGLALATSIDALAVGITLPLLGAPLLASLVTIGVVTGLLSIIGLFAGRRFGAALGRRLDVAGGCVLIALGVKILIEHLRAG